ncbi:mechanosensitive ion channel family protein [Shewanella cyperi]|uniref:mechanosensitive ion channel family protein n=1 Tax=Shewanella cyperi TaxID=2814292 RepID=UPI001A94AE8D|nr:mechanosensitive ion channel domain-containing protein [Shewanella cyperi]QSX40367.1 mechanosensitive ion channel [Shewanella cyperi]
MKRILSSLLLLGLSLGALADTADSQQQLQILQSGIETELQELKQAKGELLAIGEYRISTKTQALFAQLAREMEQGAEEKPWLLPLIRQQLVLAKRSQDYLDSQIKQLGQNLGKEQGAQALLAIARRESQRDELLQREWQLLGWGKQLGMDTSSQVAELGQRLSDRGDRLDSLLKYTQEALQQATAEARAAGKDVSAEQTARLAELRQRLAENSASLNATVALIDELGMDSAELKKTLFSVSGDITQDVLNLDVASGLARQWLGNAESQLLENGPRLMFKLFIFVLILAIASLAGKLVKQAVRRTVSNSKLNFSRLLQDFFTSLSSKAVFTLGLLIALSQLGFELGPLLAGFGIAGVIIGFALQDTLSNFASGMMILIYRPYDVGDLITAAGVTGRVSHMSLVSTTVKTLDNQRLIIPNNKIWGDTINNITAEQHRRIDMTFGISYSDNIEHAETILSDIVQHHPKVLDTPGPTVRLHLLGESSVDFVVRPWVKPDDYWEVYWDITKAVKMRFDAEGITIPFPQRDVHFYRNK